MERLESLTELLEVAELDETECIDDIPTVNDGSEAMVEESKEKDLVLAAERHKSLFKDIKVFLNREVMRMSLTFVIRVFGGKVSWGSLSATGATFSDDDPNITHQIVDRPNIKKTHLTRYYVQPQWIYDCVNAEKLLPVDKYFPDVDLPPHLSPFADQKQYQPHSWYHLLYLALLSRS